MPPPPLATTSNPLSTRQRTASASSSPCGSGDGTTRRHPLPSGATANPRVPASPWAVSLSYIGPIGFDGEANAGSSDRHERLGDERGDAQAGVVLEQGLLEQVADHADGFGADHVEGRRVCALVGLALEQQVTDLRAVAERQHELVRSRKRSKGSGSRLQVMALYLSRYLFSSARERVPAESGDDAHVSRAGYRLDSRRGAPDRSSREPAGGTKLSTVPDDRVSHAVAAACSTDSEVVLFRQGRGHDQHGEVCVLSDAVGHGAEHDAT